MGKIFDKAGQKLMRKKKSFNFAKVMVIAFVF